MTPEEWKIWSEIAGNLAQVVGLGGGLFLLYQWIHGRRDRATDVLLELDRQFTEKEMVEGRQWVESDEEWDRVRIVLLKEVAPEDAYGAGYHKVDVKVDKDDANVIRVIDKLFRFYVLLCGVRNAKQVPDSALRTCFRYWLAHYYSPKRRELRLYVDSFYPTLSMWLKADCHWTRRWFRTSFFGPEEFGWTPSRKPGRRQIQRALRGRVLVLTGAGISADSGIPTYRGEEGYWRNLNPKALARRSAFEKNPRLIWEWYRERRNVIQAAAPNAAHRALVGLSQHAQDYLVVTQNVDDLHERAGLDPGRIVHIHGEILENKCIECDFSDTVAVESEPLPRCPKCSALLRPGVVWFDEDLHAAQIERVDRFLAGGRCDLVLVIGTTATFDYIVDWALKAVSPEGCLIEVNPEPTRLSAVADLRIRAKATKSVPKLIHGSPPAAAEPR